MLLGAATFFQGNNISPRNTVNLKSAGHCLQTGERKKKQKVFHITFHNWQS